MSPSPLPPSCALSDASVIHWADAQRANAFANWLQDVAVPHDLRSDSLRAASADASFRRYFRIDAGAGSFIIMDAPPQQENCQPFVTVAQLMQGAGLRVPEVLAWDQTNGFMLLTDLGGQTMMQCIDPANAQANLPLYLQAVQVLITWQAASRPGVLPPYNQALLRRELELFPDWYLAKHRGVVLDAALRATLERVFERIIAQNLAQPQVYVHRDFMPRNLMAAAAPGQPLGVLDFQDAVYGPITYDIASLMRDAFLSWDEAFCLDVTVRYWEQARKVGLPVGEDFGEFYRAVEWMGLQRHLKVAGIFARLTLRDGKPQYLADTPRFIRYIRSTCARYRELTPLLRLVDKVEGIVESGVLVMGR